VLSLSVTVGLVVFSVLRGRRGRLMLWGVQAALFWFWMTIASTAAMLVRLR
jgi:hypothetical protein